MIGKILSNLEGVTIKYDDKTLIVFGEGGISFAGETGKVLSKDAIDTTKISFEELLNIAVYKPDEKKKLINQANFVFDARIKTAYEFKQILKELKVELAKYGISKFIHRFKGIEDRIKITHSLQVLGFETPRPKGKIKFAVFDDLILPLDMVLKWQKVMPYNPEDYDYTVKEVEAEEAEEIFVETFNLTKPRAFIYVLLGWRYVSKKDHYSVSSKVVETVHDNVRGKKFNKEIEVFNFVGIEANYEKEKPIRLMSVIEKRPWSIHEYVAIFDVILRMYSMGAINDRYVVVTGQPKKEELAMIKKYYPIITTQTIQELTGLSKDFSHKVKEAILNIDKLNVVKQAKTPAGRTILFYMNFASAEPFGAYIPETNTDFKLFTLTKDLIDFKIEKGKRTFTIIDGRAFTLISQTVKELGIHQKNGSDACELYFELIKMAGSKVSKRHGYISYDFFGDVKKRGISKARQRIEKALKILYEAGLINSYRELNKSYEVDLGGELPSRKRRVLKKS